MRKLSKENKRRLIYVIPLAVVVLIIIIFGSLRIRASIMHPKDDRLIAVVNKGKIYESDVRDRMQAIEQNLPVGTNFRIENLPENVFKAVVLEHAIQKQMDKDAQKAGYYENKEIEKLVAEYKKFLVRERFIRDRITSKITEEQVRAEYNKLAASLDGQTERRMRHILVESEEEADRLRRSIQRSGNFEKVAEERSLDKQTADLGGDLGYVLKDELPPEFGNVAFMLKVGEVSKPVETQLGWHIIRVDEVRKAQALPFEEVEDEVRNRLQQRAIQDYVAEKTKDMKVETKIDLVPLVPQQSQDIEVTEDIIAN